MRKQILVVKHPEGWAVKRPGAERASFVTSTQAESIGHGRRMSQTEGAELTIQGRNGQFRDADSHGRDTFPPKGWPPIRQTRVPGWLQAGRALFRDCDLCVEILRDVSSLAEKIRLRLGERAMFRGMNFWCTQLDRLGMLKAEGRMRNEEVYEG